MQIINLLWTGGWDSSFRLLYALLIQKKIIKPYYIIDINRPSFAKEIETINKIKEIIENRYFDEKDRLLPINFFLISDIKPNENITQKYLNLRENGHLGIQYEWIARFAEENSILDLELSIHKDDKAHIFLEKYVENISDNNENYYKLKSEIDTNNNLTIFKYYKFPIFDLTKTDMLKIATKNNFDDIIKLTWFCYKPNHNKPCGICAPCRYTIEEGLGERIPIIGKIKYNIYKVLIGTPIGEKIAIKIENQYILRLCKRK